MIKLKSESIRVYLSAVLNKKAEDLSEEDINQIDRIFISGLDESGHTIPFDFEDLDNFPSLNSLTISNISLTRENIQQISNKKNIKQIDIEKCSFNDENTLVALNHLECLELHYCTTNDYKFLKNYFRLRRFRVIDPKDETILDLSLIAGNYNMKELVLQRCALSNEGAVALMPNIEILSLLWSSFGDGSVAALSKLNKLKLLYTSSPVISALMENRPEVEIRNNLNDLVIDQDGEMPEERTR